MTHERAIAAIKMRLAANGEEREAMEFLVTEFIRMRRALGFYAKQDNYLDGVPMVWDGMESHEDMGMTARYALRLEDVAGAPVVRMVEEKAA